MTDGPERTVDSISGATTEVHSDEAYCSACNRSFPSDTKVCPHDGARLVKLAAERDTLIGRVLDERYEIRAPLGKGGMGTVYRGWQLSVDREVAIKVIHPKLSNDRSAVKRFLREARLASRLGQPNIVNVYDFGQSEGVLYLVMELLRGHTLSSELGNGRRINPKRTVAIAAQLCDALEAAHAQGIVHRDLKPSNIVILDDPPGRDLIKVLDFGLAKSLVQDSGSVVTNTDALLGTPLYMAPEQIEGKDSDQRADLYALGCILYEMLTGKPPFVDGAVSAVLARHVNDAHAPLPAVVPSRLRALIDGLLAKDPEQRVQSAGDVRRALDDIREAPGATPLPFDSIPEPADTIPDVSEAFAETYAAPPTPTGMVVGKPVAASAASPAPASRARRYALVAMFVLVPLAAAFVLFGPLRGKEAPSGAGDRGGSGVNMRGSDDGISNLAGSAGSAETVVTPPAAVTVDAGVQQAEAPAVDAGTRTPKRPSQRSVEKPKAARPDAGVSVELPEIDFVPGTGR